MKKVTKSIKATYVIYNVNGESKEMLLDGGHDQFDAAAFIGRREGVPVRIEKCEVKTKRYEMPMETFMENATEIVEG